MIDPPKITCYYNDPFIIITKIKFPVVNDFSYSINYYSWGLLY